MRAAKARRAKLARMARTAFVFGGTFCVAAYWYLPGKTGEAAYRAEAEAVAAAVATPLPAPAAPASPPPAASAAQPQSLEGLSLYGVSAAGGGAGTAVLGFAPEAQRAIRVGSDYRPGIRLVAVGAGHAVLASGGSEVRLELAQAYRAGAASETRLAGNGGTAQAQAKPRMGMVPRKSQGRTDGFAIRDPREVPALQKAGLRQGDVILAVNGQSFDSQEKLLDLPREIAGSYTAEFEIERAGRRMKVSLPVNARPNT